jgi:putative ABC transport system permease protein
MHIGPILRAMNHSRTRVVLIILEIAMTLAIVTNCVNVILAEQAKMAQPSGFDDDNMVWMRSRPFSAEFQQEGFIDQIIDADVRTIAALPGVRAVANTHFRPWEGGGSSAGVKPDGVVQEPTGTQFYFTTWNIIETLGARLTEGRPFREGDHGVGTQPDPANVVIISRDLAGDLFPDGLPNPTRTVSR